jgi:DNA ligase 1
VKAFADLYRRLDQATATRAKQTALIEAFAAAKSDPTRSASAAWLVYFLAGGKPRQSAPTRLLWRLAIEQSGLPEWLVSESYNNVGDLAEMLSLLLPSGDASEDLPLDVWMRERLLTLRPLEEEEKYARLVAFTKALPADQRLTFFKLITGEMRVGVSRLQVIKALSEVAQVDEKHMAQRMMGYAQTGRTPAARDFEALLAGVDDTEGATLAAGQPYPFYLAQSWARSVDEMEATLGPPQNWIAEWKFDGIRAQLVKRDTIWRLWSRGEELISDSYPDLAPLADALPEGVALDGELVVLTRQAEAAADSLEGLATFASLQQRLGRKIISAKTLADLPVAFIAYDLLEFGGRDIRAEPQYVRRAELAGLITALADRHAALPIRLSPEVVAGTWQGLAERREAARALGREGLMLKARAGAYGIGRRKGDDRTDVWWKWKLDPMSVDAVLIYAQRGHGRRSGVYSDYTFALWDGEGSARTLVPFAKAYSGLSDAEMREVDAIIRRTTKETFGPVRSVEPTLVFELGFEGLSFSKRHKSGVATRFPRMLRWRRDKPVEEADTLDSLRALLPNHA